MIGTTVDIPRSVFQCVSNQMEIPVSNITPNMRLVEDLHADSLDVVVMAMEYERRFDIRISERDITNFSTVGDVIAYLMRALERKDAGAFIPDEAKGHVHG